MLTQEDKRRVQICVYVLFSVVEYFFLTYVWLVFENAGSVLCCTVLYWPVDTPPKSHPLYYHLLKKHMDTRCYQTILSVFERWFVFLYNDVYVHVWHQKGEGNDFCFLIQMPGAATMTLASQQISTCKSKVILQAGTLLNESREKTDKPTTKSNEETREICGRWGPLAGKDGRKDIPHLIGHPLLNLRDRSRLRFSLTRSKKIRFVLISEWQRSSSWNIFVIHSGRQDAEEAECRRGLNCGNITLWISGRAF